MRRKYSNQNLVVLDPRPGRLHRLLRRWLVPAVAATALAHAAGAQSVGTLNAAGVDLDNGVVRLHFSKNGSNPIEVDVTDLATGHSYLIGGDTDLWRTQLVKVSDLWGHMETLTSVGDLNCSPTVQYVLVDTATNKSLTLTFTSCKSSAMASDSFTLKAKIVLDDGAKIANWELIAPTTTMTQWAYWNSGYYFSIFEDHVTDPTLDYELLTSWGTTTKNPGQVVIDSYPANKFHAPTQLSAFYDSDGNGLYVAFADGTGDYPKEYLYESVGNDRVRIFHRQYFDTFAPTRGFRTLPLAAGRFTGDWFNAAEIYRNWVDGTEITSRGLLVSRTDIADEIKDIQMVGVITQCEGWEPKDYACPVPGSGCIDTVANRIDDFKTGRNIDNLTTLQFGPGWPVNGGCGIGAYTINPSALADMAQMADTALDLSHGVYIYDTLFSESDPTWAIEWAPDASVGIAGPAVGGQGAITCGGPPQCAITPIDPSTNDWKLRMFAVGQALGAAGVDGVFVDNMFPEKGLYCFSQTHGHAPGFGPYLIRGYAETFQNLRAGATPNEQFFTYTEAFVEGYIRNNSMYSPAINTADWVTNDDKTDFVPLTSVLYHHYAVTGPAGAAGYFVDYSAQLKSCSPQLPSCQARRDTAFLVAYSWINGGPLFSVDTGFAEPQDNPFSFEVPPSLINPHYLAITDFEARLARVRGQSQTRGFLNTGLRLRDLEFLEPEDETVDVILPFVPGLVGSEGSQEVPALLSSVWKKADDSGQTDEVAVAMINHSSQNLSNVAFTFDPAAYGMCSSPTDCSAATFHVYETDLDNPAVESLILTFSGTLTTGLPGGVDSEDARYFRIVRVP